MDITQVREKLRILAKETEALIKMIKEEHLDKADESMAAQLKMILHLLAAFQEELKCNPYADDARVLLELKKVIFYAVCRIEIIPIFEDWVYIQDELGELRLYYAPTLIKMQK